MSDQEDAWREFANAVGGRLTSEDGGRRIFKGVKRKVVAPVGRWSLTRDTFERWSPRAGGFSYTRHGAGEYHSSTTHTLMEAQYQSGRRFRFSVYCAGFFGRLGRGLGAQDIEIGDAEFDRDFIVKGDDAEQVQRLLASAQLREAVRRALSKGHVEIKEPGQLYFQQESTIKDAEHLIDLHELFEETLNKLQEIGSASA